MSMKIDITPEAVYNLYWDHGLSTSQIASQYDCNAETVRNRMKEYNIPRRTDAESQLGRKHSDETCKRISDANLGRKASIDTRKKQSDRHRNGKQSLYDISKEELEEMYCIQGMNQSEIGRLLMCGRGCVRTQLKRHGIPLLSKSDACSAVNTGRGMSPENRKADSERNRGENNFFFGKHFRGEEHPRFGKHCTDETKMKISEANKGKGVGENNFFFGKHFVSDANPNWRGGISFEPYCSKFNEVFKESIREKFGRVCFLCLKTEEESGRKLSVHHVNYNKDCLCDGSDCVFVPLCMSCHAKTNYNRDYWTTLIIDKLSKLEEVNYV